MSKPKSAADIAIPFVIVGFLAMIFFGGLASADVRFEVVGSIIGSAITIAGAYIVFRMQADDTDQRHLMTVRELINDLRLAGEFMATPAAVGNPEPAVAEASIAYEALQSVALQLQSTGPAIARVVKLLEFDPARGLLLNLRNKGIAVPAPEMLARGNEVVVVAGKIAAELQNGL